MTNRVGTGRVEVGRRRVPDPGVPRSLAIPAAVALAFLIVPLGALLLRTPWSTLPDRLASPLVRDALTLSLVTATLATVVCLVLGLPLAFLLAHSRSRWGTLGRALVTVPLVLPPVVGGVALLLAFGRNGVLGAPVYQATGLALPFSTAGVVVAEAFVAMPFLVLTVEGVLRSRDARYDRIAAGLGAGPWTVLRRVTLPMIGPGIVAGAVLAWARALGEFGATITFAGSLQGRTQTMPLAVYVTLEQDRDDALVLSVVLLAVSILVLVAVRQRTGVLR